MRRRIKLAELTTLISREIHSGGEDSGNSQVALTALDRAND
jgi:hypothetical protein